MGGRHLHVDGGDNFFKVFAALGAGDRHDVVALRQDPGERQLRRRATFLFRDLPDAINEGQVPGQIITLESRRGAAVVIGREIIECLDLTSEEAATERAIGYETDAEFTAGWEDLILGVPAP